MSLAQLLQSSGLTSINEGPSTEEQKAQQDPFTRYRPQLDGNYNANPQIQEKNSARDDAKNLLDMTMEHADSSVGLEKSTVMGIRVPSARVLKPGVNNEQLNPRALSKSGLTFGKPQSVSRKDLYKLGASASKTVSLLRKMGFNGTIHGFGHRSNKTDHDDGNAVDFMVGGNKQMGNQIASYGIANRNKLNIKYVIWNQRIASASTGWKWKKMADRGSNTANHKDHPHFSFY